MFFITRFLMAIPMLFIAALEYAASTTGLGWLVTIANPAIALPIYALALPAIAFAFALSTALFKKES